MTDRGYVDPACFHSSSPPALLTDLYELTMAASYFAEGMFEPATFSLFVRHLPANRTYLVTAGLHDVLVYLQGLHLDANDIEYLRSLHLFGEDFLAYLAELRFEGDVWAMPEGTVFFPDEPVLEVTAPVIQAQLIETYLLNQVHFQSLVAAKAARCVWAAGDRRVIDFSLRRTFGSDAGLKVARSAYLAGFTATSNVLAGQQFGIPVIGTMAHSFVETFEREADSFRAFARSFPDNTVLLIDTYDTLAGARKAALIGREMAQAGKRLRGVRLDSGDMVALSNQVRRILDDEGLGDATIVASGGWDEYSIEKAVSQQAPIDVFAVGSKLGVSADLPFGDMVYKLVSYAGSPVAKLSPGKATRPGEKQVFRSKDARGSLTGDVLSLRGETEVKGEPLLTPVMRRGTILGRLPTLEQSRERLRIELDALDAKHKRLLDGEPYPVKLSPKLKALQRKLGESLHAREVAGSGPQEV